MERLIKPFKSIIVSCDVGIEDSAQLVKATAVVEGIGGYKVGAELTIGPGLTEIVSVVKEQMRRIDTSITLPVIYDHQKAGTDTPHTAPGSVKEIIAAGADALIIFPFGGPATERAWIKACQDNKFPVLVGGHMTQPDFLEKDGGYIADSAPPRIYRMSAELGVRDFVLPGNKPELVRFYYQLIKKVIGGDDFTVYAPGFIAQGGSISAITEEVGDNWHAIVGRGIYKAKDIRTATEMFVSQIAEN